jgi:hypothetical protein
MTLSPTVHPGPVRRHCRPPSRPELTLCTVRPSLLDLRFTGDPWLVARPEGRLALCLGDYQLVHVEATSLDAPWLNSLLDQARHRRPRVARWSRPACYAPASCA